MWCSCSVLGGRCALLNPLQLHLMGIRGWGQLISNYKSNLFLFKCLGNAINALFVEKAAILASPKSTIYYDKIISLRAYSALPVFFFMKCNLMYFKLTHNHCFVSPSLYAKWMMLSCFLKIINVTAAVKMLWKKWIQGRTAAPNTRSPCMHAMHIRAKLS